MSTLYSRLTVSTSKNRFLRQQWRCGYDYLSRRTLHSRRALPYKIEEGLGDFLPPPALKAIGVDWQEGLLSRLSDEVRGTQYEYQTVLNTVIGTAPDREMTLAFNYASQALNNSFFLDHLKPPPPPPETDHESDINSTLQMSIRNDFGGMSGIKLSVSAAAMGMMSSGWVWVVTDTTGRLSVIPTFGAGTLLVRARQQAYAGEILVAGEEKPMQFGRPRPSTSSVASSLPPLKDGSIPTSSPSSGIQTPPNNLSPRTSSRSLHSSSSPQMNRFMVPSMHDPNAEAKAMLGYQNGDRIGENISPIFCVSVHEHAWVSAGLGVWGKEDYLSRFWTVLDWQKVSDSYMKLCKFRNKTPELF